MLRALLRRHPLASMEGCDLPLILLDMDPRRRSSRALSISKGQAAPLGARTSEALVGRPRLNLSPLRHTAQAGPTTTLTLNTLLRLARWASCSATVAHLRCDAPVARSLDPYRTRKRARASSGRPLSNHISDVFGSVSNARR